MTVAKVGVAVADEKEAPTPIPIHKRKSLEKRTGELETEQGKVASELSKIRRFIDDILERLGRLEKLNPDTRESDRPSQADLSLHPNRARATLKNIPAWSVVVIFTTLVVSMTIIVWLITRKG